MVEKGMVTRPNSWFIFENIMLFLNAITCFYSAITRFLYFVTYSIACVFRVDISLFPKSLLSWDFCYASFMATAVMEHTHHNPNMLWAVQEMQRKKMLATNSKPRDRWKLGYLLLKHPVLLRNRVRNGGMSISSKSNEPANMNESELPARTSIVSVADTVENTPESQ
jgi:hypothetical protein